MPQRKPKTPFNERKYIKPNNFALGGPGRSKNIDTPDLLYSYFEDFKKWCEGNPYEKFVGLDKGRPVFVEQARPVVFIGLEGWLSSQGIVFDLSHYERNDIFRPTIKRIKSECKNVIVQGALVGIYNANLTARIEGIKENIDTTSGGEKITGQPIVNIYKDAPPLADDENQIDK